MLIRLHSAFIHAFFYAEIPLHGSTCTQRHFGTQWQARLRANTFTRQCLFCARFLLNARMLCVTGMLLITHALSHFYTGTLLHRDAFAQGCFHKQKWLFTCKYFYRGIVLHWANLPKTSRGAFTQECIRTGSFYQWGFLHRHTTSWFLAADVHTEKKEFGKHMQNHSFSNPHCSLTSMYDNRHVVQEGCVSWASIHVALVLYEKM